MKTRPVSKRKRKSLKLVCVWSEEEDGNWDTGCGGMYSIITGTPEENEMKFCCYCGAKLREGKRKKNGL